MATGLPSLIVGVGGTGLRVLQRVKERLIETYYGEVPPQITLLAFDTALQSPTDTFVGIQLNQKLTLHGATTIQQELHLLQTHPAFTMDEVLAEAREGRPRWNWVEVEKLDRLLPPHSRSIAEGAGAFRPVGRTAFFLNYERVRQKLQQAMQQVLTQSVDLDTITDERIVDKTKRNVFLVGSFAGGTGSGSFLDLAALIRSLKQHNDAFSNIVLIGIVVLPRFFAGIHDDPGRRIPNTYAGLRELDRFMRAHKEGTPYRYTNGYGDEMKVENQLLDLCYLVDVEDYTGRPAGTKPDLGGLPAIADMIVAHTDLHLGLRLNAANSNIASNYVYARHTRSAGATAHYVYQSPRYYSALNCHTVIFPREDVATSLSLRFLLDLIDNSLIAHDQRGQLSVPTDPLPVNALVAFLANNNPTVQERMAAQGSSESKTNPFELGFFVQTMLQYVDRRFNTSPEYVLKWLVEDTQMRKAALNSIWRSLEVTTKDPADPSTMSNYVKKVRFWQEKYLGQLVDPHNLFGDRVGGAWAKELENLVSTQRMQLEKDLQVVVLNILNQRQEVPVGGVPTSLLRANRLGYVLALLQKLKDGVRAFIRQADQSFGKTSQHVLQLRRDLEEHRARVVTFRGPAVPIFNPNPGPAYLRKLRELAEAECQHLLHTLTVDIAIQFGGDNANAEQTPSVLDTAIKEIERWTKELEKVRAVIAEASLRHEARRKEKYAIGVRAYITDPQKFPGAAEVEESLYQRYKPVVLRTLLGPDAQGSGVVFCWEPCATAPFDYQISTREKDFKLHPAKKPERYYLFAPALGVEALAREWQAGSLRLMAEQIRGDKLARVATYLPKLYADQGVMLNSMMLPHSKALVRLQHVQPNERQRELYLALDPTSDDLKVNEFYSWFGDKWKTTEQNQDYLQAESNVSCIFLTLYHGLELNHFHDFNSSERGYRALESRQGCLHLFPEERLAAAYEAQLPTLKRSDWGEVKRLHPEVVIGLRDGERVRSFAHALVSGLIKASADGAMPDFHLTLPAFYLTAAQRYRLTRVNDIHNFQLMGPHDQLAARVLQAFQTYTLIGRPIDDQLGYTVIDHNATATAFQNWFNEQHQGKTGAAIEQVLKDWETDPNGLIAPLFHSEGKDPRFRDLGIVLMLELIRWRQLFR